MLSKRYPFIAKEGWGILFILSSLALFAQLVIGTVAFLICLCVFLLFLYLFRDPSRHIPSYPLAVLSPAHGIVTLIEDETDEVRLKTKVKHIQIVMHLFHIYALRSPIEGKVIEQWCSGPAENGPCRYFVFYIQSDEGDNVVTAIGLRNIMRRFHIYFNSGERIGHGQRCGYLYFGGTIDVFLPLESKIQVKVGDYVQSGSTVLAQLIHSEGASAIQSKTS